MEKTQGYQTAFFVTTGVWNMQKWSQPSSFWWKRGLYEGHLHQSKIHQGIVAFFFSSFTRFTFVAFNLNWPAQTAEESEPVFDEQNLVLSPGVNTHTCPTMEDRKQNLNSDWVLKVHSVVLKFVKSHSVLSNWFGHANKLQVHETFTEETI